VRVTTKQPAQFQSTNQHTYIKDSYVTIDGIVFLFAAYQIQRIIGATRILLISLSVCYLKILPIHKMIPHEYQTSVSV
jgi:hypothetical protein